MHDEFCTMRKLGALFGVTSHVIGRELKGLGLRTSDGQPSCRARESGLAKLVEGPQPWIPLWVWHREMTVAILEGAGFEVSEQSCSLVAGDNA